MNIFYLDKDPVKAAEYHTNRHIVKMTIETAQILSTAHRVLDTDLSSELDETLYRKTHFNHPCCKWVRESSANYLWAYELFKALCREYTSRYGKIHATQTRLYDVLAKLPQNIPCGEFTTPPACMPDYLITDDVVESYRQYYLTEKTKILEWKNKTPYWANVA